MRLRTHDPYKLVYSVEYLITLCFSRYDSNVNLLVRGCFIVRATCAVVLLKLAVSTVLSVSLYI